MMTETAWSSVKGGPNRTRWRTPVDALAQVRLAAADPAALRAAIAQADIVPLLMSLVQLTGDCRRLTAARPHIQGAWSYQQRLPSELQEAIRTDLVDAIIRAADLQLPILAEPSDALLPEMLEVAVGQKIPEVYFPVFREEMSFGQVDRRSVPWRNKPAPDLLAKFKVIVVGAGFSGILMGIKLQEAGIPYLILEKNAEVGGTWFENTYPGCGVDTPSHFYSYAFQTNDEWTRFFPSGREIQDYILRCVEKYRIRDNIRFSEDVKAARYDQSLARWMISTRTTDGSAHEHVANVLISSVGALNRPSVPPLPGLSDFAGPCFHTAKWDHGVSLDGKCVAMIGTGASGMQVGPTIAPDVEKLLVFQRSPHWAIRHPLYHADVTPGVRFALRHVPFYASWYRVQIFWAASDLFHHTLQIDPEWTEPTRSLNAANDQMRSDLIAHIRSELSGREDLIAKVIPDYPPFGKRMLRDNQWYQMLKRSNVDLITTDIERIDHRAIVSGGQSHPVDVIVLATGFQASRMLSPITIEGRNGVTIRELWGNDNPRAHLGITVPGFPNFYMVYGPNTNLAHGGSAIFHSECQVRYIMLCLREMIENQANTVEVRQQPFDAYNAKVDAAHKRMVWSHPGVTNWYKNKSGRVVMNSPWRLVDYRNLTAELDLEDYDFS